ncbi:MAG: LysR substrate-binding domain-containing protein [Desulfatiglandales bacterium]
MINFTQFRDFYQVAKNLNFTAAANELFISQPAVTAQVKLFEDYCKLKLFKKRGRKIYLTDEGKTLYNYAVKIFEYEREIESIIEDMRKLKRGTLRLGTTKTYARYFMPFLISRYHKSYPQIKIHLDEGSSLDMCNSLFSFKNELVIVARAIDNPDICFMPFSQEELIIILSPSHPLVKKKTISLKEIAREPIIMKENGSGTRKQVCELFAKNGLTPNILVETSNTEFIKQLVARKYGISFLVKAAVERELKERNLASVSIEGPKILLDVSIAYLKNCHFSPSAQTFMDILKKLTLKQRPNTGISSLKDMINVYNK